MLWSIALTVALRLVWGLAVPFEPVSDSNAYFVFASNIAAGHGYGWEPHRPSAYWPVGPAAVYAAAFLLLGAGAAGVAFVNILASAAMTGCGVVLADRWFGRPAARAAGLLFALWPTSVMFTTALNSELMFGAAMLAALAIVRPERPAAIGRWALAGPLLALAALIRPTGLLIAPVVGAVQALRGSPLRLGGMARSLAGAGVCCAVMLACIAPWSARNHRVFGEFVLISTNGGPNFWMGNNPETTGHYMPLPGAVDGMGEVERDEYLKSEAVAYIKQRPVDFAARTLRKFVVQHAYETIGVGWNEPALTARFGSGVLMPLKLAATAFWWGTLALAFAGAAALLRREGLWSVVTHPTVVLWGYFSAVHAITVIQDRYHLQWSPFVMLLAAAPLAALAGRAIGLLNRSLAGPVAEGNP